MVCFKRLCHGSFRIFFRQLVPPQSQGFPATASTLRQSRCMSSSCRRPIIHTAPRAAAVCLPGVSTREGSLSSKSLLFQVRGSRSPSFGTWRLHLPLLSWTSVHGNLETTPFMIFLFKSKTRGRGYSSSVTFW